MFAAIRRARRWVHLEFYVFEEVRCAHEKLSELLVDRRAAGVQIAVIYDAVGSAHAAPKFLETLRRAGVQLLRFNPLDPLDARRAGSPNRRDHRKILIVDGTVAIVGGVNFSSVYESAPSGHAAAPELGRASGGRWRDTDLLLRGPAVAQLQQLFLEHWEEQKGDPLQEAGFCPLPERSGQEYVGILGSVPACGRPSYYNALLAALRSASSRVWITAGYFLPTAEQNAALIGAARRRVDVRLVLPSHNDSTAALAVQRFGYAELLKAGVQIYEREGVILHAKTVIVDNSWSAVGSSNFDKRSVRFNDEVDVVVVGTRTAQALARLFLADIRQARRIEAAAWRRRPWLQRTREWFWKPWENLL
ncbi:MAG: phospholipase D-like domain-containing protein [Steroidobacteraceae bacterium]